LRITGLSLDYQYNNFIQNDLIIDFEINTKFVF